MTDSKPDGTLKACGGMRLISEKDPDPGTFGFTSVVSMSVQLSPLTPQLPAWRGEWRVVSVGTGAHPLITAVTHLSARN